MHWMCHASDRWLTGDRVSFMSRDEGRALLAQSFDEAALIDERRVAPWRNNIMTLVKALGDGGLVGLITLGVILWLFSGRKVA